MRKGMDIEPIIPNINTINIHSDGAPLEQRKCDAYNAHHITSIVSLNHVCPLRRKYFANRQWELDICASIKYYLFMNERLPSAWSIFLPNSMESFHGGRQTWAEEKKNVNKCWTFSQYHSHIRNCMCVLCVHVVLAAWDDSNTLRLRSRTISKYRIGAT